MDLLTLQKSNQLKAIAILMMLCLHLFNTLDYSGLFQPILFVGSKPVIFYISLFCDACVPIFAFVSGYGLYYKYKKSPQTFMKDNFIRLKKLYLNYWVIIVLFAVLLGWILGDPNYPGTIRKLLLNLSGLDGSYNGAWWFFTIYVFFVLSSSFWFKVLDRLSFWLLLPLLIGVYFAGFYLRIYKADLFIGQGVMVNWFYNKFYLFFCTLPQFLIGAFVIKYKWADRIKLLVSKIKYVNLLGFILIAGLIVFHGIVPNFVIAPFLGLAFILIYAQMKLPRWSNSFFDFMAPHV